MSKNQYFALRSFWLQKGIKNPKIFIFSKSSKSHLSLNIYTLLDIFSTGKKSNTNFTGLKYIKNFGNGLTFVGNGFAGYTYIDKPETLIYLTLLLY